MYCEECKTNKVVTGCPYCLKKKVKILQKELDFYKNELETIHSNKNEKYSMIHSKCMEKYLSDFAVQNKKEYRKSRTINNK